MAQEPTPSAQEAKAALRAELRGRLAVLDREWALRASERLMERVLALPEVRRAGRVFACLSFGAEVDTRRLVEALRAEGREVFVPRTERGDERLHVHPFPCALRTLGFGLEQPCADAPQLPEEAVDSTIDAALVLGLGFDRRGYRLGYGRGYFDRFLLGRPFPAVGLAFGFQLLERLPVEAHDVPMAAVVTEEETVRPPGGGER